MTQPQDHDRWRDEIAAYTLDALPDAERSALESHLEGCDECRAYLRWLRPAEGAVATSVEQITPPRSLRRALLASVRKADREAPLPSLARRRPRWFLARPVVASALAVMIGAALIGGYILRGSGPSTETVTAEATAAAPPGLEAHLVREGDSGTLELSGLPLPKRGRVYEAWVRRGERISPSTVFVPDRSGAAAVALPDQLEDADEVMVTREPVGGSEAPTTAPMLHVPFRQS